MAINVLTKSDIKFDEIRILRQTIIDPATSESKITWYINVGYKVQTQEGEEYNKDRQIELTGANLTTIKNFFDTIKAELKGEEGI